MNKYIAVQNPDPDYNYEWYFDDVAAESQDIWIGGNKDYKEFNHYLVDEDDIDELFNRILDDIEYETNEQNLEVPTRDIVYRNTKQFFKKNDNSEISPFEATRIYNLANRFMQADRANEKQEIICRLLEITHNKEFKHGMLRGSSQDEWMNYICPEEITQKYLDWIEAVIFGTGSEFIVTDGMVDENTAPEDILGLGKSSTATATYFCAGYTGQNIRNELAEDIGCKPDEIDVYIVDNYHRGKFEKI